MGFRTYVNRALIAMDAGLRGIRNGNNDSKTILIVFQQIFGDSVVIQDSLFEYEKIFPKSEGYEIRFLVRPSVLSFMKSTMPLTENVIFEAVDFKKFLEDYVYYKGIVGKYGDIAGTIIVPGTSFSAEIFAATSKAKHKIGLIRSIDVTKPRIMAYFYKKAYTETVRPEKTDMMLIRHRKLINYLYSKKGLDGKYKAKLPKVTVKDPLIDGHYAVMCPGSSKMEKCWPIERFAEVADHIVEKYGLTIHLCGGKEEELFASQMMKSMKYRENIVSHIGTTSFSDWSSIVQHSDIVIGNDSATMHLAAAARVPSVCIAGVYDKYQFFPYNVDVLEAGDRLPVTIIKDMPCEWCRTIGYDAGYNNEECKKRIEAGLCSTCIDLITIEEVKTAVDKIMKEDE